MTITQVLKKYSDIEIEPLACHVLGKHKEFLYTNPDYELHSKTLRTLTHYIQQRRSGKPLAYIVGYKYFYGLAFTVNTHVLIPRPETEWLVERAIIAIHSMEENVRQIHILDVGTGSGCIPISIAKSINTNQRKRIALTGIDISTNALAVAKTNARKHRVHIQFHASNLFSKTRDTYNLITANLPYVPNDRYAKLKTQLSWEPKQAITDGTSTGLVFKRFFKSLSQNLKPNGLALLEIDEHAKPLLHAMVKQILPHYSAHFHKDLHGRWRYLELTKKVA